MAEIAWDYDWEAVKTVTAHTDEGVGNKLSTLVSHLPSCERKQWAVECFSKHPRVTAVSLHAADTTYLFTATCVRDLDPPTGIVTTVKGGREAGCWIPERNPLIQAILGKAGEEAGEFGAAQDRCSIQGLFGEEPNTGKVNYDWLMEELADLEAMRILILHDLHRVIRRAPDMAAFNERVRRKVEHKRDWHRKVRTYVVAHPELYEGIDLGDGP